MIDGASRVFGILGRPVSHSLSPAMHNAAFAALKLNAVYVPFPVTDLAQALQGVRGLAIAGVSVTIPFKEDIMALLDEVDPTARRIGAVNTVVNRDGRLWGCNTDWQGARAALEAKCPLAGRRALLLGAGGAGRAIVYALLQAGAAVTVADADGPKALALAREFEVTSLPLNALAPGLADILINASPVGMPPREQDIPLDPELLSGVAVVMDIVYSPLETRLLREAAARGCQVIDGLQMLIHQGARQCELFTGQPPPVAVMRQAAYAALARHR